ncbi:MAG TPA: aromatic-ring-hydroxylating dioxygenase subunit beta [Trebonia sp.]
MTQADEESVPAGKLPVIGDARLSLPGREALLTRLECERFLYDEAALLDAWALDAWFDLFADDGAYVVPATDAVYGDPDWDLGLINEDKGHLAGRVQRLKSTWAHIENPHSRTSRLISSVRVLADDGQEVALTAAFVTHRSRPQATTEYAGTLDYRLRRSGDSFLIVSKVVRLVHETLRDSGGVLSILL